MIEEITEEVVSTGNGNFSAMENCVTTPEESSVRDKKIGCSITSCIHLFQKYNLQLFKNKKMQSSVTFKKMSVYPTILLETYVLNNTQLDRRILGVEGGWGFENHFIDCVQVIVKIS